MSGNTPISETDAIFARAYAHAIKTKFQLDVGEHDCILTSPVTQRGIPAGDLIYPQMTNYLLYRFADSLQYSDNPNYAGGSAGSYIQQLRSYIEWVQTQANPSQAVVTRMAQAREAEDEADAKYWALYKGAVGRYNQTKKHYSEKYFWEWVAFNYPRLSIAERVLKSAQNNLRQVMQLYFGPDAANLSTYHKNIANAQGAVTLPGYNQDGLVDDQEFMAETIKNANSGAKLTVEEIKKSTIRIPAYTIPTYTAVVQNWITAAGKGAKRDQVVTIDINQGRNTKWEDFGFKEALGGISVGFWPFFSAEIYVNSKWETRTLHTSGREDAISLQLAMIGMQKFDIQPGQWDVPNIKTLFPNRLPDAPDVLGHKYARIVSILVGYDVELKVEFASDVREEVNKIYEEVKTIGGRMSIFGFRVSTSGHRDLMTDRVETQFEDVKWDKVKGLMSLTPTAGQVYPTILAAVAQRFD